MAGEPGLNMPRFYLKAVVVVGIIGFALSLRFPREVVLGVLTGGALSIINLREMHKGLRVVLRMERPSAGRLWFSAILRLIILATVIIVIAALKVVNLLGLLAGFAVVPPLLAIEGLIHARRMQASEESMSSACSQNPRQQ
jgi:hypothetical protein